MTLDHLYSLPPPPLPLLVGDCFLSGAFHVSGFSFLLLKHDHWRTGHQPARTPGQSEATGRPEPGWQAAPLTPRTRVPCSAGAPAWASGHAEASGLTQGSQGQTGPAQCGLTSSPLLGGQPSRQGCHPQGWVWAWLSTRRDEEQGRPGQTQGKPRCAETWLCTATGGQAPGVPARLLTLTSSGASSAASLALTGATSSMVTAGRFDTTLMSGTGWKRRHIRQEAGSSPNTEHANWEPLKSDF